MFPPFKVFQSLVVKFGDAHKRPDVFGIDRLRLPDDFHFRVVPFESRSAPRPYGAPDISEPSRLVALMIMAS